MEFFGIITTLFSALSLLAVSVLWLYGLIPVLWRLGNGLVRKEIVIYAKGDNARNLERLVSDMKIFKGSVKVVSDNSHLGDAQEADVHLLRWCDSKDMFGDIADKKKRDSAIIIYCPFKDGKLDDAAGAILDNLENGVLTQFRGRLLNDIVTSMITTNLKK